MSSIRPISVSQNPVPISTAATDRASQSFMKEAAAADRAQISTPRRPTTTSPDSPPQPSLSSSAPVTPARAFVDAAAETRSQSIYSRASGKLIDTSGETRHRLHVRA
jgi:hypothetical protein